jgi:hypothetical protein
MDLDAYMKSQSPRLTLEDVALKIGYHKSTVSRALAGKGCSRTFADAIEDWTDGVVTWQEVLAHQRTRHRARRITVRITRPAA